MVKADFQNSLPGCQPPWPLLLAFFAGGHSIFSSPWPLVQGPPLASISLFPGDPFLAHVDNSQIFIFN